MGFTLINRNTKSPLADNTVKSVHALRESLAETDQWVDAVEGALARLEVEHTVTAGNLAELREVVAASRKSANESAERLRVRQEKAAAGAYKANKDLWEAVDASSTKLLRVEMAMQAAGVSADSKLASAVNELRYEITQVYAAIPEPRSRRTLWQAIAAMAVIQVLTLLAWWI